MTILKKFAVLALPAALALNLLGCGDDFLPPSYLDGLRVLSIIADPVEAGPADQVAVMPVLYLPEGDTLVAESWSFCPFSLGPTAGYQCALPACQVDLSPDADGVLRASPGALALQCAAGLQDEDLPEGIPAEIPDKVDVYFNYQAESSSGETRQAVLRLALWTQGPPTEPNQSPAFASVTMGGVPVEPGDSLSAVTEDEEVEVRVQIDPDSLDEYTDQAGERQTEEAILSFYTSAGRFEFDRAAGEDTRMSWKAEKLEPGQTRAEVYVAVRDLRGGQAVFGPVVIPIVR